MSADVAIAILVLIVVLVIAGVAGFLWLIKLKGSAAPNDQ